MANPNKPLPPEAERAAAQLESTSKQILEAIVHIQSSPRWQELQLALSSLGRLFGADPDEAKLALPEIHPAEAADALGFLARTFLFDPAAVQRGPKKSAPVFRLQVPVPPRTKVEEGLLAKLINGLDLATTVGQPAEDLTEIACSAGGLDKPFITLAIGPGKLELVMNLASARGSWAHVSAVLEQVATKSEVPLSGLELKKVAGVLSLGVTAPAPDRLLVNLELKEDLQLEGNLEAGPFQLRLRASQPLLQLENDAASGAGRIRLDAGAITLQVPLEQPDQPRAALEIKVAGLTAELEAKAGDQPIRLNRVSLGSEAAVVTRDKAKIGFAEINAAGDHTASFGLRPQGADAIDLETPAALTVGIGWDAETWAVKTTPGTRLRLAPESDEDTDDLLQVIEGELSVAVTGAKPVKAGPGKFLVVLDEDEGRKDEKHPLLRLLTVR